MTQRGNNNTSPGLDLSTLPTRMDRRMGAEIITRHLFPVSHRSIEAWPLAVRRVNGRALYDTRELLAHAQTILDAAPSIRSGRTRKVA